MDTRSTRRQFLKTASAAAAVSWTAASYARIPGANDRIRIAQIGCGSRGYGAHMPGVYKHKDTQNFEIVAVCDPWKPRREEAAARCKEWFGVDAKQFVSYKDVMPLEDVDAVMIASCDHQHTTHLTAAAKAKKDAYVEKPLATKFDALKMACDAVKEAGIVVQVGTQLRSMASFTGCRDLFKTGILGKIGRIEHHRNTNTTYWHNYIRECKQEDVDWKEFLMDAPDQPFDPVKYTGWYGYRDFTDGPVCGYGSHTLDLIHYITGTGFPKAAVCLGGIYTWDDQYKFTCPDSVTAIWTYPEFLVEYSSNFGNSAGCTFNIFGDSGVLDMVDWEHPKLKPDGVNKEKYKFTEEKPVEPVERPDHFLDWLQCLRTRQAPNANIDAGYQHGVACLMAVQAYDTGKRMIYDAEKREIREG